MSFIYVGLSPFATPGKNGTSFILSKKKTKDTPVQQNESEEEILGISNWLLKGSIALNVVLVLFLLLRSRARYYRENANKFKGPHVSTILLAAGLLTGLAGTGTSVLAQGKSATPKWDFDGFRPGSYENPFPQRDDRWNRPELKQKVNKNIWINRYKLPGQNKYFYFDPDDNAMENDKNFKEALSIIGEIKDPMARAKEHMRLYRAFNPNKEFKFKVKETLDRANVYLDLALKDADEMQRMEIRMLYRVLGSYYERAGYITISERVKKKGQFHSENKVDQSEESYILEIVLGILWLSIITSLFFLLRSYRRARNPEILLRKLEEILAVRLSELPVLAEAIDPSLRSKVTDGMEHVMGWNWWIKSSRKLTQKTVDNMVYDFGLEETQKALEELGAVLTTYIQLGIAIEQANHIILFLNVRAQKLSDDQLRRVVTLLNENKIIVDDGENLLHPGTGLKIEAKTRDSAGTQTSDITNGRPPLLGLLLLLAAGLLTGLAGAGNSAVAQTAKTNNRDGSYSKPILSIDYEHSFPLADVYKEIVNAATAIDDGDTKKAKEHLTKTEKLLKAAEVRYKKSKTIELVSRAYVRVGFLYRALKDNKKATEAYKKASQLVFDKQNDNSILAPIDLGLGKKIINRRLKGGDLPYDPVLQGKTYPIKKTDSLESKLQSLKIKKKTIYPADTRFSPTDQNAFDNSEVIGFKGKLRERPYGFGVSFSYGVGNWVMVSVQFFNNGKYTTNVYSMIEGKEQTKTSVSEISVHQLKNGETFVSFPKKIIPIELRENKKPKFISLMPMQSSNKGNTEFIMAGKNVVIDEQPPIAENNLLPELKLLGKKAEELEKKANELSKENKDLKKKNEELTDQRNLAIVGIFFALFMFGFLIKRIYFSKENSDDRDDKVGDADTERGSIEILSLIAIGAVFFPFAFFGVRYGIQAVLPYFFGIGLPVLGGAALAKKTLIDGVEIIPEVRNRLDEMFPNPNRTRVLNYSIGRAMSKHTDLLDGSSLMFIDPTADDATITASVERINTAKEIPAVAVYGTAAELQDRLLALNLTLKTASLDDFVSLPQNTVFGTTAVEFLIDSATDKYGRTFTKGTMIAGDRFAALSKDVLASIQGFVLRVLMSIETEVETLDGRMKKIRHVIIYA